MAVPKRKKTKKKIFTKLYTKNKKYYKLHHLYNFFKKKTPLNYNRF